MSSISACTESSKPKARAQGSIEPRESSLYSKRKCDLIYDAVYSSHRVPFEAEAQPSSESRCDMLLDSSRISHSNTREQKFGVPVKSKMVKISKKSVIYTRKING